MYPMFLRTSDGRIVEDDFKDDFTRNLEKRRKLNGTGEDCYLNPDGSVTCDEAKIVAAQRIWKEIVYAPGGRMYEHAFARWQAACAQPPR